MFQRYGLSENVDRWVSHDGGTVTFSGRSVGGRDFSIVTYLDDANRWANGELIQTAFWYLTADEREILMTGIDQQGVNLEYVQENDLTSR